MKTLGLIGGMSWESTVPYYQTINRVVAQRVGGLHSAKLLLYSVDFAEIARFQHDDRWEAAAEILCGAARTLAGAGAELLVLCTNTMHRVAPALEAAVAIPLLHIADTTAARIVDAGHARVGLLATRFTMEHDFYRGRLERFGLEVLVPPEPERALLHRVIYEELCLGKVLDASREAYQRIASGLIARGAQAIVLGCTEIGMLLRPADLPVPAFDTTEIHAEEAALHALGLRGT